MKKNIYFPIFLSLFATVAYSQEWQYEFSLPNFGAFFSDCGLQKLDDGFVAVFQDQLIEMGYDGTLKYNYSLEKVDYGGRNFVMKVNDGYIVGGYTKIPRIIHFSKIGFDGNQKWRHNFYPKLLTSSVNRQPLIIPLSDESVIISSDTAMYKIGTRNGNLIWRQSFEMTRFSSGDQEGNNFIIGSNNGKLQLRDSRGFILWSKDLGIEIKKVKTLEDGYFVLGKENEQLTLIKTNKDGTLVWSKTYPNYRVGRDIITTSDGHFLVTGQTIEDEIIWLKLDEQGNELAFNKYGKGLGNRIIETPDGGFLIGGTHDNRLIKTDENGQTTTKVKELLFDGFRSIYHNNIQTAVHPNKAIFQKNEASYFKNPTVSEASTIRNTGLIIGGYDADTIYLSFQQAGLEYFQAGYIDATDRANWNKVWQITREEIKKFKQNWKNETNAPIPFNILVWPALGNPHAKGAKQIPLVVDQPLAPFVDVNEDGIYNAYDGDYPKIKGDFMYWSIMTETIYERETGSRRLKIDVATSVYGYECSGNETVNNTIFVNYEITNRSNKTYDSTTVGLITNFEIGCFADDQLGCSPMDNTFYGYNETASDNNCGGMSPNFGNALPVQTVTLLSHTMDYFTYSPANGWGWFPWSSHGYFNQMTGRWFDDTPFTIGGNGYDAASTQYTNYAFPDNPAAVWGWSMARELIEGGDYITFGSAPIGSFPPNSTINFTQNYTFHPNISHPSPDVSPLMLNLNEISAAYEQEQLDWDLDLVQDENLILGRTVELSALTSDNVTTTYQWSNGVTKPNLTITEAGNYQVVATNILGCIKSDSVYIEVEKYFELDNDLYTRIYPNPAKDFLSIDFAMASDLGTLNFELYNINGQTLTNQQISDVRGTVVFNTKSLASGTYVLKIHSTEKMLKVEKILKVE